MIKVCIGMNWFAMNGHACKVEGEDFDVVCAGASMLAYTLADNLKRHEQIGFIKILLMDGDSGHICIHWDGAAVSIMRTITLGYQRLAQDYPEHLRIIWLSNTAKAFYEEVESD